MSKKIVIVHHSGYGHTAKVAAAVAEGAGAGASLLQPSTPRATCPKAAGSTRRRRRHRVRLADLHGHGHWQFRSSPTPRARPGSPRKWQDKLAAGFANSASLYGDKHTTMSLPDHAGDAARHAVGGRRHDARQRKASTRDDLNNLGMSAGLMTATPSDASVDEMVPATGHRARLRRPWRRRRARPGLISRPAAAGQRQPLSRGMDFLLRVIQVLPLADWLAGAGGVLLRRLDGLRAICQARSVRRPSVLASTNRIRQEWMLQTYRDNRIVDAAVSPEHGYQPGASSPSTTIFIIGGLIAAVGATDKTAEMVQELPFAARTSVLVLDQKLLVLTGIFVHAFFRFTWSMRQYSFGALLIGSAPSPRTSAAPRTPRLRRRYAERAGRVMGLGAGPSTTVCARST